MNRICLYFDYDVNEHLGDRLRRRGYDVETTKEAGNQRLTDDKQLEYAAANWRAILSHNRHDFIDLHKRWINSGREHWGIVTSSHLSLDELERRVVRLLQDVPRDQARNQYIKLDQFR